MEYRKLIIILDPAHGTDILGKCSPDNKHFEALWSRDICHSLSFKLKDMGFRVVYSNSELREIGLSKRRANANAISCPEGFHKLLLSLHNNAAGSKGLWMKARGSEIFTWPGQSFSDKCADILMKKLSLEFPDVAIRSDYSDGDVDKEEKFTVLGGDCSAVLLEWLFQDNKEDVALLKDPMVNQRLVSTLISALVYIDEHLSELI